MLAFLMSVNLLMAQTQTLTITTQKLATQYGWTDSQCQRNFDLNDVLSVEVDSAGTMKYNSNTKQLHCYQWLGGFTIRAKAGCSINRVKLTYYSVNSGVMTMNWGKDGKSIPESDRILTNQVVEVNASSVKFFVGTTGTNTDGQIRLGEWEVEYTQSHSTEELIRTATDLGKQFGWSDGTCPVHIPFNNALSLHSDQDNNVKYYSTTKSFHCYQWCKGFYIKARPGTLIKSVALTYESLNDGVLIQNWGTDGKNIPEDDWIASGNIVPVNGDSVHFFTGNKHETGNCQIHITGFSIVYIDTLSRIETFSSCPSKSSDAAISVLGDEGYYSWQLSKFQREGADLIYGIQGTRLLYNGAIAMDGEMEGGVKDVSFEWRASSAENSVRFMVKAGETTDDFSRANPGSSSYVMNYTKAFGVKSNCALSISMGAQSASAQPNPIIGPVTITPYLLFKVPYHIDSIDTNLSAYDLKPRLINNTDEIPQFEVVSNTTGDEASIVNGVVDLSGVMHAGEVKVKASCFGGDVYTTLTLHIGVAPLVYFAEPNKVVYLGDSSFVNPLIVFDSVGAVTYLSSDTSVASVNDTGLVMIQGIGQTIITAHVAASEKYVATSTSFYLSVIYMPQEGTYRIETFSQCRKKKVTEGFAYVVGDDDVYDWNISNFSRDKQDTIVGEQGVLLNYGGAIASNGVQEGGIKYLSFNWRAMDPILPVHFFVNMTDESMSYHSEAVGDASLVFTYSSMVLRKSNTILSVNLLAKENPAQSRIVVGPLQIVPYLLFTNKYVELTLPRSGYDCAEDLINNTEGEGEITYSIVSSTCDTVAIEGSVLDLSATTTEGDIQLQATWGEVSTTMTVHVTIPSGLNENENVDVNANQKIIQDGKLWILRNGEWWTILGNKK